MYNCSTKGSDNLTAFEKIDLIVQENTGIVSTAQIINSGIDNTDGKVDYWFNYGKFQT